MPRYIIGHSIDTTETAPLPKGTTAFFYARPGEPLHAVDVLAVLAQRLTPAETVTGPARIANYKISEDDPAELAREMSYDPSMKIQLDEVRIVGVDFHSGAKLCTAPTDCTGLLRHECQGLLAGVKEGDEVHLVFCRGQKRFANTAAEDAQARSQDLLTEARTLWARLRTLPWEEWKIAWRKLPLNTQVELLTVNSEAEDLLACLHIDTYARGDALAAYRAHEASTLTHGEYVAKLGAKPDNTVKQLVEEGKKRADQYKWAAREWVDSKDDRSVAGASMARSWQELTDGQRTQLLALDEYPVLKSPLAIGPVRQWLNGWYAVPANLEDYYMPPMEPPAAEMFQGLDRHNGARLMQALEKSKTSTVNVAYVRHKDTFLLLGEDPSWFLIEAWLRSQSAVQQRADGSDGSDAEHSDGEGDEWFPAAVETEGEQSTYTIGPADDPALKAAITRLVSTLPHSALKWKEQ